MNPTESIQQLKEKIRTATIEKVAKRQAKYERFVEKYGCDHPYSMFLGKQVTALNEKVANFTSYNNTLSPIS